MHGKCPKAGRSPYHQWPWYIDFHAWNWWTYVRSFSWALCNHFYMCNNPDFCATQKSQLFKIFALLWVACKCQVQLKSNVFLSCPKFKIWDSKHFNNELLVIKAGHLRDKRCFQIQCFRWKLKPWLNSSRTRIQHATRTHNLLFPKMKTLTLTLISFKLRLL